MTADSALAHAKVNLVLEVGGRRADGYHEIDTVLQEVELADRVTLSWGRFEGTRVTGPFAAGTPADDTNLAWRAAAGLAERCGASVTGLGIEIEKRIPPAGGLGGGASDAAAVLRLLAPQWEPAEDMLLDVANAIGSDEAFFLVGGTARARGRGDQVVQLSPLPRHDVVLFIPPDTLERKTARLFDAMDGLPVEPMTAAGEFARVAPQRVTVADVCNSFDRVARRVFPRLGALWGEIEDRCSTSIHLAGAGPTLFWIGPTGAGARIARLATGTACQVVTTATIGPRQRPHR